MYAIRFVHQQHTDGAVTLRVEDLPSRTRVTGIAESIKDGVRIVFLRLVIQDQHDLAFGVDPVVIVVMIFRGGNTVSREDHWGAHGNVVREAAREIRRVTE